MKYSTCITGNSKLRNCMVFLRLLIQRPLKIKLCSTSEPDISSDVLVTPAFSCCFVLGRFVWVGCLVCYWFLRGLKPSWANCPLEWVSWQGASLYSERAGPDRHTDKPTLLLEWLFLSGGFSAKLKWRRILNAILMNYKYRLTIICSRTVHSTEYVAAFLEPE